MDKMELYGLLQKMIEVLGEEQLLADLFCALTSDELEDCLTYIADMRDVSYLYED